MKPRINIYNQISSFYSFVFDNQDKINKSHISLYMFLLNQNNRNNWSEWFKLPFDLAMFGACIGNKGTYYRCLSDLQDFKLIKYKKGKNDFKAPQISIVVLSKNEPLTVPLSEPLTVPLTVPLTGQLSEQLSVLLTGNIDILITDNYKLITNNIKKWIKKELELSKKEIEIESLDFSKFDFPEDAIEIWTNWINYKKEQHKDSYASKSSMQTALNQLCKLSKGNSKIAYEIVNNSIANLYKGLFELKTTPNTEPQKPKEYEPNAHLLKIVNRLERDGDITTKQAEIARVTIANATTFINVSTFMDGLKNLEKLGEDPDLLDNGNTIRIG